MFYKLVSSKYINRSKDINNEMKYKFWVTRNIQLGKNNLGVIFYVDNKKDGGKIHIKILGFNFIYNQIVHHYSNTIHDFE